MELSEEHARELADRVLGMTRADEASVSLWSAARINLRFANNDVTTSGITDSIGLNVNVSFGKRSASVSVTQTDRDTLLEAVARAEALAKLAPENPEHMPPPGPAEFAAPIDYAPATAEAGPGDLASWIRPVIEEARSRGVDGAGYLERAHDRAALATSSGLFVHQESTACGFSMTARARDGGGSGWASTQVTDTQDLDLLPVGRRAIEKALLSRHPAARAPGRTTVVLEPAAARDLVSLLAWNLDRRDFDEKRSFLNELSKNDDPVGEALFGGKATISSNPLHEAAPCATHSGGLPLEPLPWIENGILQNLHVGRYWAQKRRIAPLPGPGNLIVAGEGRSLEDLIGMVEEGVLITRFWYIRMVRPQSLLYTGLTRDGTFRIEKGKIAGPVNNFRFNESPVNLLRNLGASGLPERVLGGESEIPMHVPALLVENFNLSSISEAV